MRYREPTILILMLILFLTTPTLTRAQNPTTGDTLPPIPVSDAALRSKEVGITVFGFTVPGVTLDGIAIQLAKASLTSIVNSTIDWVNNGFDGNPAFVTNPKQYFADIANGVAGEFIEGSDLGALCSPFRAQIRLALARSRTQQKQYQCTLTDVVANIEGFYNNFDEGGWNAWFAMTQHSANNPYGAYLTSQIELDARIARALEIENKKLNWGNGFLSFERCLGTEVLDNTTKKKTCVGATQIVTPGAAIEEQLGTVFGTGVRQLELADELDELVGALFNQLIQRTILGAQGLLR